MIPLSLAADFSDPQTPDFIVRLAKRESETDAGLAGEFEQRLVFVKGRQTMEIERPAGENLLGDVILARPTMNRVDRWIRSRSQHNTLLVTERCDQLCLMCSQPPKKTHVDMFGAFRQACELAPPGVTIGLSGGEPGLFKEELFDLIECTHEARHDLSFHVLTNGQHFTQADRTRLLGPAFRQVLWGVPLYAPTAETHDEVVQKPGAFEQLLRNFSILAETGQRIELRTTLLRTTYGGLARLARFVAARLPFIEVWALMQLERIGFAKGRWAELFFDHSAEPSPLLEAVSIASARGVALALYNFPYCTVPPGLRRYLHRSISDWKQAYAPVCAPCSARSECAGFFAWHASLDDYAIHGAIR